MGGINPAGLYGGVRALQDVEDRGMRREAFNTDQQIRRAQLGNEAELQPLRKRALELGVEEGGINIDMARLTKKERERVAADMEEARGKEKLLNDGLSEFMQSSNPQTLADTAAKVWPKFQGGKASRNPDGSITMHAVEEGGKDHTFHGKKWPDGTEMSPDQEASLFFQQRLNPVKNLQSEYEQRFGIAKESAKQDTITRRAINVANIRATATGERKSEAWYARQHSQIKPVLDSVLKTQGTAGSFIAGYAHENDAALRTVFEERMGEEVENGSTARAAVKNVTDDVRKTFDRAKELITASAKSLTAKQIDPRSKEAVDKAARAGNVDAKRFQTLMQVTEDELGYGIAKYIQSTLSGK